MVSEQGRNLVLAIVAGFVFGAVAWLVPFFGGRLTEAFVQANWLVYHGWYWQLLTSQDT